MFKQGRVVQYRILMELNCGWNGTIAYPSLYISSADKTNQLQ